MPLKEVLIEAERIGLTDVILPFIIIFTLVFAVLQRSKVLGVDAKGKPRANYNAMVALVIGFFALVLVRTIDILTLFTQYTALLLVAFVFVGIVFSLLGVREHHKNTLMLVALLLLSFVFLNVLVWTGALSEHAFYDIILPIYVVVVLLGLVWLMLGKKAEPKKESKPKGPETPGIEKEKTMKP